MKADATTDADTPSDGRPTMMPVECSRASGVTSQVEKQLRRRVPEVATASHRHRGGQVSVRYTWSEAFRVFIAARCVRLGIVWPVALDISARSVEGLAFYALQGLREPGAFYFGVRPRDDADSRPLVFEMPPNPAAEAKVAADFKASAVLAVVVPVRELLAEFCERATALLGVEVRPDIVLACHIAGTPDRSEVEA